MTMSDCWPQSKAIALVFCLNMTTKCPHLKLIDFDSRLTRNDNERFLATKQGYILGILLKRDPK